MRPNLLRWQYQGYAQYHARPANLLIHIVAVPAFIGSAIGLIFSALTLSWAGVAGSAVGMLLAFLAQAIGHQREATPSIPFAGPGDAVSRIVAEQFITFPRFVLSGGWSRALKASRSKS